MSLQWVACGTCYTKTEGTELDGIELQCPVNFFKMDEDLKPTQEFSAGRLLTV